MLARRAELTRTEEAALEEHLSGCAACRETAEIYGRQTAFMRSLPMVQPPHALRAGVLAGLEGSTRRRWPLWPSFRPSFRPSLVIAPLGVCAASVLAAVIYQHQLSSPSTNSANGHYSQAHATTQAPTAGKKASAKPRHTASAGRHHAAKH